MRLAVNPTRMELLKLKKKLILARRGHKLLKDKQDELMKNFLSLIDKVKLLRPKVEEGIWRARQEYLKARSVCSKKRIKEATSSSEVRTEIVTSFQSILSLRIPRYNVKVSGDWFSYRLLDTPGELDSSLKRHFEILPQMVELTQIENTLYLLADEIEKTRRRVNALEYILIPNILETIKYITQKLEELERGNLTRLMKIKDIVRSH